jgi:hypothetical protein
MMDKDKTQLIDNEQPHEFALFPIIQKSIIALFILIAGFIFVFFILDHTPEVTPVIQKKTIPSVETSIINQKDIYIPITLQGTTQSINNRIMSSNINGTITEVSPKFKANSHIKKGEWLFTIENPQYEIELSQAFNSLQTSESHLKSIVATININAQALKDLGVTPPKDPHQLKQAQIQFDAATVHYNRVVKKTSNKKMFAAFEARIIKQQVSTGDLVTQGVPIAQTISNNKIIAKLAISDHDLKLTDTTQLSEENSPNIIVENTDQTLTWNATAINLEYSNQLNGQFNYITLNIHEPFATTDSLSIIGNNIKTTIRSKKLDNVYQIPLSLLKNGNEIWLLTQNNRLKIQPIKVLYQDAEYFYIQESLPNEVKLIVNAINFPVDGMLLNAS